MGHEAESMTQQDIQKIRAQDPMEFEYLRIGNTLKSVSQLSYLPPPRVASMLSLFTSYHVFFDEYLLIN